MDLNTMINSIVRDLKIGALTAPIKKISGGFMHQMYCLETEGSKYAVKFLNPAIMKRHDVFENFKEAERLERLLQVHQLPVVPALEFGGTKMQYIDNQYFYIFEWVEGETLHSEDITREHCETIGALLGKIHRIELIDKPFDQKPICIDWDRYIKLANINCPELVSLLADNKELLYECQRAGNAALKEVPALTCISNGDMDSKNVLWSEGSPRIIDLESLSYGNPFVELFQLALCWSGFEHHRIDYGLLEAFIKSYYREFGEFQVDWEVLYNSDFGRLEWLEYNVKRALMLECSNEEEKRLGLEQARETMSQIIYYWQVKNELLKNLNNLNLTCRT